MRRPVFEYEQHDGGHFTLAERRERPALNGFDRAVSNADGPVVNS
jgi:hypothetical protein